MTMRINRLVFPAKISALTGLLVAALAAPVPAQPRAEQSCDQVLLAPRESKGQKVGPESCLSMETRVTFEGRDLVRLDIGVSGKVEGYLPKTGYYINYFTSAPDLVFPQGLNPGPIHHGVGQYDMNTGHAIPLVFPASRRAWNGKMYVSVHGRGRSFKKGGMKAWNKNLDPANPTAELNKFELVMLRKGYAVAKTYRSSDTLGGEVRVTLDDGTTYAEKNLNDNARVILDWVLLSENVLQKRLGRAPSRTYFYGRSAGGRIGRSINYVPGLNVGPDGRPIIDGILSDDSATGLWLPVVMKDGKDVLFATDAEKAAFVPQIDVSHQMYNREAPGDRPDWVSTSYLENKRNNARILRDKGLTPKHRMYEVRRVSHDGGETLPLGGKRGEVEILEISYLFDTFIDHLDGWVEKGVQPPASRSDWAELGDANRDGEVEGPAIAMPEIACPLGVYFQYPPGRGEDGATATAFAPFTGESQLEPLNGQGVFVDMNGNGIWDYRETPTQAWQRLGLLPRGESLTRERYTACVQAATGRLVTDGFFSPQTAATYAEAASAADIDGQP